MISSVIEKRTASVVQGTDLPDEVVQAMSIEWGVIVDAYLVDGARVGDRYAAIAFGDCSGVVPDGATIATVPVRCVASRGSFRLLQTFNGNDHYVLVTECKAGAAVDGESN